MQTPTDDGIERLPQADSDDGDPEVARVRAVLEARMLGRVATASHMGRFLVHERLGAGAMGVVYSGYDDVLGRRVALKLLHHEHGGSPLHERLLREAQAMAQLSHPNVAQIYEVGEHAGRAFVAMELVDGRTLRAWQRQCAPDRGQVLAAYRQAARGLAAAHAAEIVHRDFKPDNVIIAADGGVKVLDFGLSRRLGVPEVSARTHDDLALATDDSATATALTRSGALVGTPAYMAPELLDGAQADARSDQFAFCVALHEALCGERPFAGKSVVELSHAIRSGAPPRRASSLPGWLRRIVLRGLASDPAARWPSMDALAGALARDPSRRRRALAVLAAIVVVVIASWGWQSIERARTIAACDQQGDAIDEVWSPPARAELSAAFDATGLAYAPSTAARVLPWLDGYAESWRGASREACLDTELRGRWSGELLARARWCLDGRSRELAALVHALVQPGPRDVADGIQRAAALEPVERCRDTALLERLPLPPAGQREAADALRSQLAELTLLARAGNPSEAMPSAERVLADARALAWPPLVARAELVHATVSSGAAHYDAAIETASAAYFHGAEAGAWDVAADAAIQLVTLIGERLARHEDGLAWVRHAELALTYAGDHGQLREARLLAAIGRLRFDAGAFAEAEASLQRAADLEITVLGEAHPSIASSLGALAIVAGRGGDPLRARALLEHAIGLATAALGDEHPAVATLWLNLGNALAASGETAAAEQAFTRSLAISEHALGPDHPDVGQTASNLGYFYYSGGDSRRAKPLLVRALAIRERALGPEHPNLASTLDTLGAILDEEGEHAQARQLYTRALAITETSRGRNHPDYAHSLDNLAANAYASGDRARALELREQALAVLEHALGPDHPEVAALLSTIAASHAIDGEIERSLAMFARALAIFDATPGTQSGEESARFAFARAFVQHGGELGRACAQARIARDGWRAAGPDMAASLREVEAWIAEAPCPAAP